MKSTETAKRIKELRNRRGFSQEELSEKSGLSLRTIHRINTESIQGTTTEVSFAMIIVPSLSFLTIMYTLNFVFIIFNTLQIHHEKDVKYYPKISFIRT